MFGKLLGDSDIDKIADQQNALNWMQRKIDERLLDAGTIITLPPDVRAYRDPDDHKVYRVESPADAAMIGTYEFTGDLRWYYQQLDMDYEAARQIRRMADPEKAGIPIVAVTANAFEEDRKIAMEAGMNGHLAKPYDVPMIMETMEQLIG